MTPVNGELSAPTFLRLDIPPKRQQLFGFLLEAVEGLATHTRARDSEQLEIWLTRGQEKDLQTFMRIWDAFQSGLRAEPNIKAQECGK